ncbi:MAG: hypothetical protein WD426_10905 [Anditalea sp.]
MEHFEHTDTLDHEKKPGKGFSKNDILQFSKKDIEDFYLMEHPAESAADKKRREEEIEKGKQTDRKDPHKGGPRPPQEEDFPDEEDKEDDPLSEVSDPNKKD